MTTAHDAPGTATQHPRDQQRRPTVSLPGTPTLDGRHAELTRSFTEHRVGHDALSIVRRLAPAAGAVLDGELVGALERSIGGVDLSAGWTTCWERYWSVSDACRRTAADDAATEIVVLAHHEVASLYEAPVDIVVDGVALCTLAFELTVTGDVVGLSAVVRGGRVKRLQGGKVTAEARLSLGEAVLDRWRFASELELVVDLPEPVDQAPPAPVPGQRAGREGAGQPLEPHPHRRDH